MKNYLDYIDYIDAYIWKFQFDLEKRVIVFHNRTTLNKNIIFKYMANK